MRTLVGRGDGGGEGLGRGRLGEGKGGLGERWRRRRAEGMAEGRGKGIGRGLEEDEEGKRRKFGRIEDGAGGLCLLNARYIFFELPPTKCVEGKALSVPVTDRALINEGVEKGNELPVQTHRAFESALTVVPSITPSVFHFILFLRLVILLLCFLYYLYHLYHHDYHYCHYSYFIDIHYLYIVYYCYHCYCYIQHYHLFSCYYY